MTWWLAPIGGGLQKVADAMMAQGRILRSTYIIPLHVHFGHKR